MTEEELAKYDEKKVKLVAKSGNVYEGVAEFTDSYDNDPDEASLTFETYLGLVEIFASEIASIEVIKQ